MEEFKKSEKLFFNNKHSHTVQCCPSGPSWKTSCLKLRRNKSLKNEKKTVIRLLPIFRICQDCDAEMRMKEFPIESASQSAHLLLHTLKEYNSVVMEKKENVHGVSTKIISTFYSG